MSDDVCEVIITADDEGWLISFTRSLVTDRLAACGHHQPIRAVYRWQGAVEQAQEMLLLAKTAADRVPALIERLQALHPYELPEIVAVQAAAGLPAYLDWVADSTRG